MTIKKMTDTLYLNIILLKKNVTTSQFSHRNCVPTLLSSLLQHQFRLFYKKVHIVISIDTCMPTGYIAHVYQDCMTLVTGVD